MLFNISHMWCWKRLLRVSCTAWRSDKLILKEKKPYIFIGGTGAKAEAPVLWPPDTICWLIGKDPDAGKDKRQKDKGVAEDEVFNITDSMGMSLNKLWEIVKKRGAWCAVVHEVTKSWTWLNNWTTSPSEGGNWIMNPRKWANSSDDVFFICRYWLANNEQSLVF